jgi:hypothetical protein
MKFNLLLILSLAVLIQSCTSVTSEKTSSADTVFLSSGVKYVVMQAGNGKPVEAGKEITTNINLMVNTLDDTVWSTYGGSEFSFVAKKDPLIAGFDEVVMLLKTGDRILAVIPPELGYGPQGNGPDIPGNAMLYFDLAIEDVLQPRKPIADLLFQAWQSEGIAGIKACYDTLAPREDLYILDDEEWYTLSLSLADNKAWDDIVGLWDYRMADRQMIGGYYYKARALDSLNRLDEAIELMEEAVRIDRNNNPNIAAYLESLKARK